jgi:signal transduction histidine kinase
MIQRERPVSARGFGAPILVLVLLALSATTLQAQPRGVSANLIFTDSYRLRPVFELWNVATTGQPGNSEIHHGQLTAWEQYSWSISAIVAALALQAGLIIWLAIEHRRRNLAEAEARQRLTEVAFLHRRIMIGEMSAFIAHELRQPLSAILSNTEAAQIIIRKPQPDLDEIADILRDIKRDDERATDIVNRLRSLLKRDSSIRPKKFDLNQCVSETLALLSDRADAARITLTAERQLDLPPVEGDPVQIQQVILNLVVNGFDAIQASPAAGRREIVARTSRLGQGPVKFTLVNDGPSIPPDDLNKIFDQYYTTKPTGMGLGLAICRKIIAAHGGRIWAENAGSLGVQFHFFIPVR